MKTCEGTFTHEVQQRCLCNGQRQSSDGGKEGGINLKVLKYDFDMLPWLCGLVDKSNLIFSAINSHDCGFSIREGRTVMNV